jgi:hypothetical protein
LRARYLKASAGFFNPFGGTVTPGSRRGEVIIEMKPGKQTVLHFGVTSERNQTVNVDNGRLTFSGALDQIINERIKLHFGFDHRALTDDLNNKNTDSNLITVGAEIQATKKLQLSAKREQNLGDPDPSYPNQTTLAATYQLSALTKLFFTQRLASAPITPIADFTANGFAGVSSRTRNRIWRRNPLWKVHFDDRALSTGECHQRDRQFRSNWLAESLPFDQTFITGSRFRARQSSAGSESKLQQRDYRIRVDAELRFPRLGAI